MVEAYAKSVAAALTVLALLGAATPGLAEEASGHQANGHRVHAVPKFRPNPTRHSLSHLPAAAGATGAEQRNAIGAPVAPGAATRMLAPSAVNNPASGLHGVPAGRVGLAEPTTPHPAFVVVTPAAPASHSAINGTVSIRRPSALLPLGGPAKSTAEINGTAWRSKH